MSTVQGGQGNIVTNGLVLNLDAANPRSYPQPYNGTTWQNIAPNTLIDPVISEFPCERKPFFIMNSFGISFPYPRLC